MHEMPPSSRGVDFAQQKTEGVKKPLAMGEVARVSATERVVGDGASTSQNVGRRLAPADLPKRERK